MQSFRPNTKGAAQPGRRLLAANAARQPCGNAPAAPPTAAQPAAFFAAAAAAVALHGCLLTGAAAAAAAADQQAPSMTQLLPVVQQMREPLLQQLPQLQQQQQQQRPPALVLGEPGTGTRQWHGNLADLAGFFDNADPTDPFTLYGTNTKTYEIEKLDGEKVVSRQRGFTVTTCVSGKAAAEETPMFNGMSTGAKVAAGDDLLCKQSVGQDLRASCKTSCGSACEAALSAYEARLQAEAGLTLDPKERSRVLKNCRHSCSYECTKSGRVHDFVAPSRR